MDAQSSDLSAFDRVRCVCVGNIKGIEGDAVVGKGDAVVCLDGRFKGVLILRVQLCFFEMLAVEGVDRPDPSDLFVHQKIDAVDDKGCRINGLREHDADLQALDLRIGIAFDNFIGVVLEDAGADSPIKLRFGQTFFAKGSLKP